MNQLTLLTLGVICTYLEYKPRGFINWGWYRGMLSNMVLLSVGEQWIQPYGGMTWLTFKFTKLKQGGTGEPWLRQWETTSLLQIQSRIWS